MEEDEAMDQLDFHFRLPKLVIGRTRFRVRDFGREEEERVKGVYILLIFGIKVGGKKNYTWHLT